MNPPMVTMIEFKSRIAMRGSKVLKVFAKGCNWRIEERAMTPRRSRGWNHGRGKEGRTYLWENLKLTRLSAGEPKMCTLEIRMARSLIKYAMLIG